jgi:ubiquinone/menaquinone biosynthesis C-methylase UbiE
MDMRAGQISTANDDFFIELEGGLKNERQSRVAEEHPSVCDYEGSDYQKRFWECGGREYEDRVEAVAMRRLMPSGGERLLEVGAGAGRNTPRFRGFRQVVLLDYARSQLALAQERLGQSDRYIYVEANAYRLPFAQSVFDAVAMVRTIHHMVDPMAVLREIRHVLHAEGSFILEYANKRNMKAIARWLLRRQAWNPFDHEPVEFAKLNFDFHPAAMRLWLREAGFKITRQLTVSHFRLDWLKRRVPLGALVALDSCLQWTGNWWQFSPSVFIQSIATGERHPPPKGAFWRCPVCESIDMEEAKQGLHCLGCQRLWPLREGIYDLKEPLTT